MPNSPEHQNHGERRTGSNIEYRNHHETLRKSEHNSYNPEQERHQAEKARHEALQEAKDKKQYNTHESAESESTEPPITSKNRLKSSFGRTMDRVRSDMPLNQRIFSKIIHAPVVEKTSDAIGSTIARPDAILSGSISAFVITAVLYFTARYFGFSLSGTETIAAFAAGWLMGILFDLVRKALRRKH